jgi:2-succinyl-5-enolpyruvyl-6-hydroxy-3-cyclohexene-1-carboxylate synthase
MTATDSYLLLRALCDELARCGLRHACTAPGSRSTPVVLSLVREPRITCWSHIDERCAGFFALGAAKAGGVPAAVTCTSGSAAANLAPAVVEAFQARVPLIVLTADRPPELRDVGAGQTIDQLKLYGSAAKWFAELDLGRADSARLRWVRALACRAYQAATQGRPGPVHLNIPLREPLVLESPLPPDPVPGRDRGAPWVSAVPPTPAIPATSPDPSLGLPARGVVIAGRHERRDRLGPEAASFAARAGYPLLADPLSGARHGDAAIARYDLLLRDERFAAEMRPALVLRVGDLPTSRSLRTWLASLTGARQLSFDPEDAWQDPAGALSAVDRADPVDVLRGLRAPPRPDPGWLQSWREADRAVTGAIRAELDGQLSEPLVAASLGEWLGADGTLVVASSMPIRDVELFFPARAGAPRVLANRGANGIDGTVSTAFGAAAASEGPVVLLIGDVALLHDIGGLLAARRLRLSLTIVVLNNDGGGIFHFLPVSGERDAFEQHVATPHGVEFSRVAALYDLGYERPTSIGELQATVERTIRSPGVTLIEVRTDREENLSLHRRVAEAALGLLG